MKRILSFKLLALSLFIFISGSSFAVSSDSGQRAVDDLPKADKVIVYKKRRLMMLLADGFVIKSYRISLGGNPVGHKQQQGDSKTPEGKYTLDWKNPKSSFYLSIHISYPNKDDRQRAKKNGVSPGGSIMVHGQPNWMSWAQYLRLGSDWTDGCIAVTNVEMDEIWQSVDAGTPIYIFP
ncbi:MAG: hypothetical protein D6B27_06890 [Gammaproteobacteria bacterium]|nr:MAG: hypothetical protein D6B27_06890 [Gammaproteobacteria bacterium]